MPRREESKHRDDDVILFSREDRSPKIVANVNANNENTKKAEKQNGQLVELELVLTKTHADSKRMTGKTGKEKGWARGKHTQLQAGKCYVTFTANGEKKAAGQTRRK